MKQKKTVLSFVRRQEIELLEELKMYKDIIAKNNIPATDRINNCYKLIEQLKNSIIAKL